MEEYHVAPGNTGNEKRNKRRAIRGLHQTVGEGRTGAKDAHSTPQLYQSPVLPPEEKGQGMIFFQPPQIHEN